MNVGHHPRAIHYLQVLDTTECLRKSTTPREKDRHSNYDTHDMFYIHITRRYFSGDRCISDSFDGVNLVIDTGAS
jgi:hypothetical protein